MDSITDKIWIGNYLDAKDRNDDRLGDLSNEGIVITHDLVVGTPECGNKFLIELLAPLEDQVETILEALSHLLGIAGNRTKIAMPEIVPASARHFTKARFAASTRA